MKTNNTAPDALQIQQAPIQQNNIQVQKQQEGFYPATKVTRELGFLSNYLVYPEAWKNEMRERHAV